MRYATLESLLSTVLLCAFGAVGLAQAPAPTPSEPTKKKAGDRTGETARRLPATVDYAVVLHRRREPGSGRRVNQIRALTIFLSYGRKLRSPP